jgi:hypothetical protein
VSNEAASEKPKPNWFVANWHKILAAALLVLALIFPQAYPRLVRRLPNYYFKIGTLRQPPKFDVLTAWSLKLPPIDNKPTGHWIEGFVAAPDSIARLDEKDSIPARKQPNIGDRYQVDGKEWTGDECLFISDIVFDAQSVIATASTSADGKARYYETTTSMFDAGSPLPPTSLRFSVKGLPPSTSAEDIRKRLNPLVTDPNCKVAGAAGTLCPRVYVFARGVPAPCPSNPMKGLLKLLGG